MKAVALTIVPLALVASTAVHAAAAAEPPVFDVTPSCKAAASAAHNQDRLQSCLDSEKRARQEVVKQWSSFAASTRSQCLQAASLGGNATYTELITCLEMTRDVKKNPNNQSMRITSTDNGPKTAIERTKGH